MSIEPQDRINGSSKSSAPLPPKSKPSPPHMPDIGACPYLGLEHDPDTHLLYVSPVVYCHRADPIHAIDLSHQQNYCLKSVHTLCPVFMRPEWGPLPPELRYNEIETPSVKTRWIWLVVGLLALSLIAGALFMWGNGRFGGPVEGDQGQTNPVMAVIVSATVTETATAKIGATETAVMSATPAPTKTPTPTHTALPTNTPTLTNTPRPTATSTATVPPTNTLVPTFTPVLTTETAVLSIETAVPLQALVNVPFLNVRTGPGTAYDLQGTIAENDQVDLTGRTSDGSWWQICCVVGETGWVIGEALEIPVEAEAMVPIISVPQLPPVSTTTEP